MGFAEGGVSIPSSTMNVASGDQLPLIKHLGWVPSQETFEDSESNR